MNILVIDDEPNIRRTTAITLSGQHEVVCASTGREALAELACGGFEAALLDLNLGNENGLDVLDQLLRAEPKLSVIVFTAYASIDTAVEAMRRGAFDYVAKPFTPEQIRQAMQKIARARQAAPTGKAEDIRNARDMPPIEAPTADVNMRKVMEIAMKAAAMPTTMLILGESGTGKSMLARAIHAASPKRDKPFVTVNCPCLTRELLESELFGHMKGAYTGASSETWGKVHAADGGTLFLDEIGEMPLEIQPKLLRLLQEREYERLGENKTRKANVRVVAATNCDLAEAVKAGTFREDLYYRLNVISLSVPPLRDRRVDIVPLAEHFLKCLNGVLGKKFKGFTSGALTMMQAYPWPGNLREMSNLIERAAILSDGDYIDAMDFPDKVQATPAGSAAQVGSPISLEDLETEHIRRVVEQSGSFEEAAEILGIDPATLYRKRKRIKTLGETSPESTRAAVNGNGSSAGKAAAAAAA